MRKGLWRCECIEREGGKEHFIRARPGRAKREGAWMALHRGAIFGVVLLRLVQRE
jgi:hypothetical protein